MSTTTRKIDLENKVRKYLYVRGDFKKAESISYLTTYDDMLRDLALRNNKELCSFFDHAIRYPSGGGGRHRPCYVTNCVTGECRRFPTTKSFIVDFAELDHRSSKDTFKNILVGRGCRIQIGGVWYDLSRDRDARDLPVCTIDILNIRLAVRHDIGRDLKHLDKIVEHYDIYRDRKGDRQGGVHCLREKVCTRLGIQHHGIDIEDGRGRRSPRLVTLTRVRDGHTTRFESIASASIFLRSHTETLRVVKRDGRTIPFWWDRYSVDIE